MKYVRRALAITRRALAYATLGLGFLACGNALAIESLKILVPAAPGGGWDQTGRALQAAMQSDGIVKKITVDNKGGAGGTIGLAQFVNSSKGDPNALMMGGMVMVGAIISNKSPVNLSQVTPIARLTGEYEVVVVPGTSKIQIAEGAGRAVQGQPRQRCLGRRFRGRLRPHPGGHDRAGVGRRAGEGQLHRLRRRRRSAGGDHGRPRRGRNQRLRRIRRADQVGQAARARHLRGQARARHRHPDAEGAGRRRRDRQLARGLRRAGHHRRAEARSSSTSSARRSRPRPGRTR